MIIGKQPKSLQETIKYKEFLETYKPRVDAAIQAVDVYTSAIAKQDQFPKDLHQSKNVIALSGISRAELGIHTGESVGPWPPLPHPGCAKDVQIIDAFLVNGVTKKLEVHERGGRDINWTMNEQGYDSVYSMTDKQGTLIFGRFGDCITLLQPAVGGSPEMPR